MPKALIIAGQTATGKTAFAVELAHKYNGELISADSRQVYKGMDIVTGKDKDKIDVPIWLYDLANLNEPFSVSKWHQKALAAIENIHARGKLPIVIGGTGLYLRSLINDLKSISIPPDENLRSKNLSVEELQKLLGDKLGRLNNSDRQNPRRLVRAIEIALYQKSQYPSPKMRSGEGGEDESRIEFLSVVLTCPPDFLQQRITQRVSERIQAGAFAELSRLKPIFHRKYLANFDVQTWIRSEYQYSRRQKQFFQKYFPQNILNISDPSWHQQALDIINVWLNT